MYRDRIDALHACRNQCHVCSGGQMGLANEHYTCALTPPFPCSIVEIGTALSEDTNEAKALAKVLTPEFLEGHRRKLGKPLGYDAVQALLCPPDPEPPAEAPEPPPVTKKAKR